MRGNIALGAGAGQRICDERWIRADERRLHLPEEMDVAAAHRQHIVASLKVNLRRFIVMTLHVADCTQIHNNRSMDLRAISHVKRSEEHTSELQSRFDLVCRLLLEKKKKYQK